MDHKEGMRTIDWVMAICSIMVLLLFIILPPVFRVIFVEETPFYATHNLHTNKNGIYKGIEFSEELEKRIVKKCLYKKDWDKVEFFDNAAKALGIVFMKFDNQEEMGSILGNINEYYNVVVEWKKLAVT